MGCALSNDLRERVLRAWQDGSSARQAAARFGVSASSAIRWIARAGQGETAPRKTGRKTTSRLDPHEGFIVALIEDKMDITLDEMVVRLAEDRDMKTGQGAKCREIDMRCCRHMPVRAGGPFEHPGRSFQQSIRCLTGKTVTEDRHASLFDYLIEMNLLPRPRMRRIKKLALITGPVGVPSSSYTIPGARTRPQHERQNTGPSLQGRPARTQAEE